MCESMTVFGCVLPVSYASGSGCFSYNNNFVSFIHVMFQLDDKNHDVSSIPMPRFKQI